MIIYLIQSCKLELYGMVVAALPFVNVPNSLVLVLVPVSVPCEWDSEVLGLAGTRRTPRKSSDSIFVKDLCHSHKYFKRKKNNNKKPWLRLS